MNSSNNNEHVYWSLLSVSPTQVLLIRSAYKLGHVLPLKTGPNCHLVMSRVVSTAFIAPINFSRARISQIQAFITWTKYLHWLNCYCEQYCQISFITNFISENISRVKTFSRVVKIAVTEWRVHWRALPHWTMQYLSRRHQPSIWET